MPYTADPYDDTKPTGATLALYLDEEMRAAKGKLINHRDRLVALEDTEASTLVVGRVRLATNAELNAGVDALHPITTAQLFSVLADDVSGAQYKVILGKNLSLRFGFTQLSSGVDTTVTFTEPFTGTIKGVLMSRRAISAGQEGNAVLYRNETVGGFTMTHNFGAGAYSMFWAAVGTEV